MSTAFLKLPPAIIDDWIAEMQAIVNEYGCSESCARLIMHSRHSRSATHTKEFENLLVDLDKKPNPLDYDRIL